ncbi:hypothetical protein [Clostridium magnum]|uniref:Uncharacterized protein n=1 Tax=Clostridium magnum DSM 2767 TaxID=1121326 RepID=A0A162SDR5_9CLOT|nr:hypothetical protein [Clostridium magnum]KZL91107.1 hypothetical protein CLMAG_28650 [Clostridium magnum DSM 2767]SHI18223.1 hypothetical protein SAMN02745944_03000 [Clostridium magnum DSM 2767]
MKIEAYFTGIKKANEAVNQLKNAGFNNSVADINDHYVEYNIGVNPVLPGNENAPNLSSLVLNSGPYAEDPTKRPLNAANPMVSGMGGFDEITDVNYKVIVNLNEADIDKAKQIINKIGGDFKDPNLDLPHRLEDLPNIDDTDLHL